MPSPNDRGEITRLLHAWQGGSEAAQTELDSASSCATGDQVYCDTEGYTYLTVTSQSTAWDATVYGLQGQARQIFTIPK